MTKILLSNEHITANIETWCQALESGEYEQATGTLYNGIGYCCLGVGAKVLLGDPEGLEDDGEYYWDGESAVAPQSFMDKVGLTDMTGTYEIPSSNEDDEVFSSLVDQNDSHGWNFKQIADLIRSRPKGLFIEGV